MTDYSSEMKDCLLLWDKCLCARNASPFTQHNSLTGRSVIGGWANHIGEWGKGLQV